METDVIVIGAGHAGCEAALASARLGMDTLLLTMSIESIAMMPCNPNIGGTSKGHLVREVDALGGEMGRCIDQATIQSKMLNSSKGPAVRSLRAQADKLLYQSIMRKTLENTPHLLLMQMEADEILTEEKDGIRKITGVRLRSGKVVHAGAVILATGTYLNARCLYGDIEEWTGPNGLKAAKFLTDSLRELKIPLRRFKTGTPARVDGRSVDTSVLEIQWGDPKRVPFSFETKIEDFNYEELPCYLTYTNEESHRIIVDNLSRSPLYSGKIEGVGPRYCPSIEDKVVKFRDKTRHHIFLEPEGRHTNELYLGGLSSSLPADVQEAVIHSMKGLEKAHIVRMGYAIEYDCIDARILRGSMECMDIEGLFFAGQICGSSGYEEAAAQGLMAGINAARRLRGEDAFLLDRSEAYIGVLIDDLTMKESHEPYRMMTSRAEYRLHLRQDNADLRLTEKGYEIGLISEERYKALLQKKAMLQSELQRLEKTYIGPSPLLQEILDKAASSPVKSGISLKELIRRPELSYAILEGVDPTRPEGITEDLQEEIDIEIVYEGYLKRQEQQIHAFRKMERKPLEENLDYSSIPNLRKEAAEKLMKYRPASVGQASRISGVSPADMTVLILYLETRQRRGRMDKNEGAIDESLREGESSSDNGAGRSADSLL